MSNIYCVKCRTKTPTSNAHKVSIKGRNAIQGSCSQCGCKKNQFIAGSSAGTKSRGKVTSRVQGAKRKRRIGGAVSVSAFDNYKNLGKINPNVISSAYDSMPKSMQKVFDSQLEAVAKAYARQNGSGIMDLFSSLF